MSRKGDSVGFGKKKWAGAKPGFTRYRVRDAFLSADEIAFFRVLQSAVADMFVVFPKGNLNRIFHPEKQSEKRPVAGSLAEMEVDFLLCDSNTMRPVLGVELDPEPRELEKPQKRSFLIDEIFITAGLPLARIYISPAYDPVSLRECMLEAAAIGGVPGRSPAVALQDKREVKIQPEGAAKAGNGADKGQSPDDKAVIPLAEEPADHQAELGAPVPETVFAEPAEVQPGQGDDAGANLELPGTGDKASDFETDDHAERNGEQGPCVAAPAASENSAAENEAGAVPSPVANREELLEKPELEPDSTSEPGKAAATDLEELRKKIIEEMAAAMESSSAPLCPQCQVPMELRTSKRGIRFYCCPNFSVCREVRGIYE